MPDPTLSGEATQVLTPPTPKPFLPPQTTPGAESNLGYPVQPAWPVPVAQSRPEAAEPEVTAAKVAEPEETEAVALVEEPLIETLPNPVRPPALNVFAGRKVPGWLLAWRKIGGGSLTLSLVVHVGLLVTAGLIVVVTQGMEQKVDFLPGGGTQQGAQASDALKHQVQQKKRSQMKSLPMQKLVSTSMTAAITLPDSPPGLIDLPDATSLIGAGKLGSSGFGSAGAGGGFNSAFGSGAVQGFTGMTFFGKLGGDGMPGTFYDLKQNRDRKPTGYTDSEAAYAQIINNAADKKFAETTMKDYYKAMQQMSFTFLAIPNMSANEGPKAFAAEKEVEPRAWFVHYTSTIEAPEPGDYRFVGFFDDALIVYINNKPVLDASWYPIHDHGDKKRDTDLRQDFGGPMVAPGRHAYAGKWFKFSNPVKIDIVIGERPGGRVGGVLLVQNRKEKYAKRDDGTPILPVFAMTEPDMGGMKRLTEFKNGDLPFEIATDIPVFKIKAPSPFDRKEDR